MMAVQQDSEMTTNTSQGVLVNRAQEEQKSVHDPKFRSAFWKTQLAIQMGHTEELHAIQSSKSHSMNCFLGERSCSSLF